MICRYDNSGLGTLSWEFARNLKPAKVLLVSNGVYQTFPERYEGFETRVAKPGQELDPETARWLLEDVDVLLSAETFYHWELVKMARRAGVKTALITMYEMQKERITYYPDLFICPSKLDLEVFTTQFPGAPSVYLPIPVATDRLYWRKVKEARHFVHTASHGGLGGRKGTGMLLEAWKLVRSPQARLTVYSWQGFTCDDPRVEVRQVNFKNYWQAWREGDVLVYPQGANGISLPCLEAYASGMAVVTADIRPFNDWLPGRFLVKPRGYRKVRFGNGLVVCDDPIQTPEDYAAKIDEIVGTDIGKESLKAATFARANSWKALAPLYLKILDDLCRNPSSR